MLKERKTAGIFEKEKHFPTDVQSEQKLGHTADFELKAVETVRTVRTLSSLVWLFINLCIVANVANP